MEIIISWFGSGGGGGGGGGDDKNSAIRIHTRQVLHSVWATFLIGKWDGSMKRAVFFSLFWITVDVQRLIQRVREELNG